MSEQTTLSHLERREIEAGFFKELRGALQKRLCEEELRSALSEALCAASERAGTEAGAAGNDLEALKRVVEGWTQGGALEVEVQEDSREVLRFAVRRCAYAEAYERLGVRDWGTVLSCERDFAFIEGFNPNIELTRTKTLMEGDDCCDFCYRLKGGSSE